MITMSVMVTYFSCCGKWQDTNNVKDERSALAYGFDCFLSWLLCSIWLSSTSWWSKMVGKAVISWQQKAKKKKKKKEVTRNEV